ncbi:MAG: type III pantothenate kinase [Clostridiales bacterium]|nr:type III pantothenate kinase [Clostridiales bacterium]
MVLLIDVGNTNVAIGGCEGDRLCFTGSCASDLKKTEDEYALTVKGILELNGFTASQVEGGIISSVVPHLRTVLYQAMKLLTGHAFLLVGSGIKTGLNIHMDNPAQLGSDLVVNAVAANAKYPKPLVFFYMGTATTLSVLDKKGTYLGGMIIPGLRISTDALSAQAAQLPAIPLAMPQRLIGRNTVECMQAGAVYGWASMLDGLVDRVEEELGEPVTAIATGGLLQVVLPACRRHIIPDPHLRLNGLLILYQKNQGRRR